MRRVHVIECRKGTTVGGLIVALVNMLVAAVPQAEPSWRPAPAPALMLPSSIDCWEPALALGPREQVYVVAGRRSGAPGSNAFDQRQVLWRSLDGGATFEGPWSVTTEGHRQADQRIAVDRAGTIYVTYMDYEMLNAGSTARLRLARSRDEGRTFVVETVPAKRVSDKPELAVSPDGTRIAIVYESAPGPTIVTTTDGGGTWNDARLIEPANGRHFWPETLVFGPDGALWFAVPSMLDSDIAKRLQTDVQLHIYRSVDAGRSWLDSRLSSSPRFLKGCAHDPECRVKVPRIGVAVDEDGRAYAAYTEGRGPGQPYALLTKSSADAGRTWSEGGPVSAARRPQSNDFADHHDALIVAQGKGRVCVVWVDDRRGALDTFARCSTDGARTWRGDIWLSNRIDGAPYKSPQGFTAIYGHYGGAAISPGGRLFAVWAEGERDYRTGSVWFNRVSVTPN